MAFFIWAFRIIVYCAAVYLSFTYIAPISSEWGPFIAGPVASLAIIGDLLLSAKMKKTDVASEVAGRIAFADRILSDRGDRTLEGPAKRDEIAGEGEDQKRLPPGPGDPTS